MSDVFISYRREDSAADAGRICDRISAAVGREHVFMDVEDISPGADFTQAIEHTVGHCEVLLAVIGPQWLELLRERQGDRDFVAEEIAAALRRGIKVIPVLVGGAEMPTEKDLPPALAPLARRQAVSIRDNRFDADVADLVRSVRRKRSPVLAVVVIGVLIAIVGSSVLLWRSREQAAIHVPSIVACSRDRHSNTLDPRMQRAGMRPYNIRLELRQSGEALIGQVEYPTGNAAIQGGKLTGGKLSFFTSHTPQFESQPARIDFTGAVRGREIDLTSVAPDGGIATGVARKAE